MATELSPRARVNLCLNPKEPDRVPISLGGSANHLSEARYRLLWDHFNLRDVPRRTLVGFYTTPDHSPLLEKLGTEFRLVHIRLAPGYVSFVIGPESQEFTDEWGPRRRLVSGYCDLAGAPLGKDLSKERIQKHPWPDPYAPEGISGLNGEAQLPYQVTSYAIVGHLPMYGNLWEMTRLLVGIENALMLTITDTQLFDHLLGRMSEVVDGFYDAFLSKLGHMCRLSNSPMTTLLMSGRYSIPMGTRGSSNLAIAKRST